MDIEGRRRNGGRPSDPRVRCAGLTLGELLVALGLGSAALVLALGLLSGARRGFEVGENVAECQQAVRAAFDRLAHELRLAGHNHNPDGDPARPDEPIEAAYDTAVVVRADFDALDAVEAAVPESTLAGGAFEVVSIGNDEIAAWVLAKPDGSSPDTLVFEADVVESVRDGDLETIRIPRVALVQDDPPYTLYRITLNPDPIGPFLVRTPVVDNVRSLTFRYLDRAGVAINATFDTSDTADDIGGTDGAAARRRRARVRQIDIALQGVTRDGDPVWFDAADTSAVTRARRKYALRAVVTPRNLGWVGRRDG